MNSKIATLAAGGFFCLTAMSGVPAFAQDFGIAVDQSGVEAFKERHGLTPRHHYEARNGGGCSPRQAIAAASRYLDDPRINSTGRGYYNIDGYGRSGGNRGGMDSVRISAGAGCDRI